MRNNKRKNSIARKNLIEILELVHNKFDLSCVQAVGVSVKPTNEESAEEKEANIVAILIVVVLIAAAAVAGIVLLGKKSKTVEIKKEEK